MSASKLIRRLVFAYRAPKAFAAFQREHEAMAAEARERWGRERFVERVVADIRRREERCPPEVLDALLALQPDIGSAGYQAGYQAWDAAVFCAVHGRDRGSLNMKWVERAAGRIAEAGKEGQP